jgi:hypothetical protein
MVVFTPHFMLSRLDSTSASLLCQPVCKEVDSLNVPRMLVAVAYTLSSMVNNSLLLLLRCL